MRKCKATKADGNPCAAVALAGRDFCFFHDPAKKKERKTAQGRGGRRGKSGASAPAKKKRRTKADDEQEEQQFLIKGAKLSALQLEEYLASAIIKGISGELSAPVLSNITKLIGVYENFLAKKRDRGDVERARTLTPEQLYEAMLYNIPTPVLLAEADRRARAEAESPAVGRGNGAGRVGDGEGRDRPGNGHAVRQDVPRTGEPGAGAAAGGHPASPDASDADANAPAPASVKRWTV